MSPRSHGDLRANDLQPKLKQLSDVLTTVNTTKQGDGRAECTEATGDDYATCAVGREVQIPPPQPEMRPIAPGVNAQYSRSFLNRHGSADKIGN